MRSIKTFLILIIVSLLSACSAYNQGAADNTSEKAAKCPYSQCKKPCCAKDGVKNFSCPKANANKTATCPMMKAGSGSCATGKSAGCKSDCCAKGNSCDNCPGCKK